MPKGKGHLKNFAISLRQQGYSYELIKEKTGVSKSTLSNWLKLLPYKANQEVIERISRGQKKSSETLRTLRLERIRRAKKIAVLELGQISKRDLLLLGIGLYIGEGSKYDRGFIQFTNSDPKVIKLMMAWFTQILNLNLSNFYMRLHLYPDNKEKEAISFWSNLTMVPVRQFGKTYVDKRTNKLQKNRGKLLYGTLHIRIRGLGEKFARVGLYHKILGWIELIENNEFAGIV
ncbi:MAG: hypothetical protein AAB656_04420 [Patescibacteria group bacterium]